VLSKRPITYDSKLMKCAVVVLTCELTVLTVGPPGQLLMPIVPAACTKSAALTFWLWYFRYLPRRKLRKFPIGSFI
jgi:hypothetical protein